DGTFPCDLQYVLGTLLTESVAGRLAGAFSKSFDVASGAYGKVDIAAVNSTTNAAGALEALALDYDNDGYLAANVLKWLNTTVATPNVAGCPVVNLVRIVCSVLGETSSGRLSSAF